MATKNAVYKIDDGQGGFDEIHLKTVASQVFFSDGDSLQDKFNIKNGTLWEGYHHMSGNEIIRPTKKLNECRGGWILVWTDWDDGTQGRDWNVAYSIIPKNTHYNYGNNTLFSIPTSNTQWAIKALNIFNDHIQGDNVNKTGNAYDVVIKQVLEY